MDVYGTRYIIVGLDDFNRNHVNRNYVNVGDTEEFLKLPEYFTPDLSCNDYYYRADPNNPGQWIPSGLTKAQVCTIQSIQSKINARGTSHRVGTMRESDVIARVLVKYSESNPFETIFVSGNALRYCERTYFGPVDIKRLKVTLFNDAGQVLDLHGQDYSFSLHVEELYQY